MMLRVLIVLWLAASAYAATPKTFAGIGDPVYAAVVPVQSLEKLKTFAPDKALFSSFVREAEAARKEGFWLDKNRLLPKGKARSEQYLDTLRGLQRKNEQIGKIVKETAMHAIQKHHTKTFRAIEKSGHPVFRQDRQLAAAVKTYENQLVREHKQRQKQKVRDDAAYLRSFENLRGEWRGKSPGGSSISYRFEGKNRLVIVRENKTQTQTLEGLWKIAGETLGITVQKITNRKSDGIPHVRTADTKLAMQIRAINKREMTLYDTRRKTQITFLRYHHGNGQ